MLIAPIRFYVHTSAIAEAHSSMVAAAVLWQVIVMNTVENQNEI
jgi:hypothetical protein